MKLTSKQRKTLFENEGYLSRLAVILGDAPVTISYQVELAPDEVATAEEYELTISPNEALESIAHPELIEEVEVN